ncbi:MAG TPA: D-arabinose 5-phosphate isomerase [Bacteroidetes bacterium]|nr:MAG: D-arabinose 5-phosphate isomerase [Ignavibacteria bacterium GWA2_54_16]HCA80620.1 D-arabinose 5-phosphate isomerase [Bacteroidota bacterium]
MSTSIERGKEVIRIEAKALKALEGKIDVNFDEAVELVFKSTGRVIVTGLGKSGLVARKIVATMNSTGTAAIFLHPADAVHGDLGMVRGDDVVICLSKSGDTEEILDLVPMFRRIGVKVIGMIGNVASVLARQSDVVLDTSVEEEACPHDLAPTASTTAMLAMGDALAIALLDKRGFTKEEFAMFHPGGNLGKRLLLRVEEMMVSGAHVPIVRAEVPLSDAIVEMTSKRLGATCIVNASGQLLGIITDGDLRRLLQRTKNVTNVTAAEAMSKNPKTIRKGLLAATALEEMESFNITQLVVVDEGHRPVGMLHLHDLVKAGLGNEASS